MKHKILLVGTLSNKARNYVTGQSIIFDGIVSFVSEKYETEVISLSDSGKYQRGTFMFLITRIWKFIHVYANIIKALITNKIDVVYYQTALSVLGIKRDAIAIKLFSIFGVPVVSHQFGNIDINKLLEGNEGSIKNFKWILTKLQAIIVEGEDMVGELEKFGCEKDKVKIIPNGFKEENDIKKTPKEYSPKMPFKVLYLSNLIFSKGYFDVLRAIDILVNEEKLNVVCSFAGKFYKGFESIDNNDVYGSKEAFEDFIKVHGLKDRITYHSGLFDAEKANAFFESNVFVLPTYYSGEGQPMSILEAMSYGCVPVVTAHGHIPMMVNDDNGCIVKKKSPKSIAEAINTFMQNPDVYSTKSEKCIRDFEEKFSFQKFVESIDSVLSKTIKI